MVTSPTPPRDRILLLGNGALAEELSQRRGSYASAFAWNLPQVNSMLFFVFPVFLLWDALMMMLLGMALYRLDILRGQSTLQTLRWLMLGGLTIGLGINGWEVARAVDDGLTLMDTFAQLQWSYHFGRLGMTLGYLGLVGKLSRAHLYSVVLLLWALQLWLSPWWLARHRYGPLEYVWRLLTYGRKAAVPMLENRPGDRREY